MKGNAELQEDELQEEEKAQQLSRLVSAALAASLQRQKNVNDGQKGDVTWSEQQQCTVLTAQLKKTWQENTAAHTT